MRAKTVVFIGSIWAVGMIMAAIGAWQSAEDIASGASRPDLAIWAVRCGAIGVAAAAQVVVLTVVRKSGRDLFGDVLRASAAVVFTLGLVGAVALAVAGR